MSDTFLRIIPVNPKFVPSAHCEVRAASLLKAFVPDSDVVARRTDEVEFVDPGENFERVLCPNCQADLTDSWRLAMDGAWSTRFSDLAFETPCCSSTADLNNLVYEWPAGFARFMLEASGFNVGRFLPEDQLETIAQSLGCPVRQIVSRV